MAKLAVDVALLPPEEIMDVVIELNQKFEPITEPFDKTANFPHISLGMGVVNEKDIPKINEILKQISERFNSLDLEIFDLYVAVRADESKSCAFEINNTEEIQKLHDEIMEKLKPFFSYDEITDEMFFDKKSNTISRHWVKSYEEKYTGERIFKAHISIKTKKIVETDLKYPIKFKAFRFGLFHMGDHGTIRKNFGMFELK